MHYVRTIVTVVLALLSIAAGFAKATKMPQEIAFFEQLGLNTNFVAAFGVLQVVGGIFALIPKSRNWGYIIMATMFALSAFQIFMIGSVVFGLVSLIPAALALALLWVVTKGNKAN